MKGVEAVTSPPAPHNEPPQTFAPGAPERAALASRLSSLSADGPLELTHTIAGRQVVGVGEERPVVMPHRRSHVLGTLRQATDEEVAHAVQASLDAAPAWRDASFDDRAAVFLRAAELLAGPWRHTLNAATMLGQSKTCQQAEIDAPCELVDFWRFNVHYARQILAEQPPVNPTGVWNRTDHRPLEGFVLAITPFNFTAIAGNLPTAPALMGNTVVWKPSPGQQYAAHHTMRLLEAAGLPPGVVNLVTGDGAAVSRVALRHPELAGIHFTGSTTTFRGLWRAVGDGLDAFRGYPRLVGETGGKDFVVAHSSADPVALATALVRGAFEYQGQKCSAASRAYLPRSLWEAGLRDALVSAVGSVRYGDVSDFGFFGGAVIDERAYAKLTAAQARARSSAAVTVLAGGGADDSEGWFVEPTLALCDDPTDEVFTQEYFGPFLAVHVYDDAAPSSWPAVLRLVDSTSPYALTGAVWGQDAYAVAEGLAALRFAAGNVYVNDKPTGAVVGQQPFGGARASGTNDKAGSPLNLLRWTSPRTVKESFVPPGEWRHEHQGPA
ncbi:L-glutamate gamma-semialdehyde dehydrogenase [Motilibacter aurantiacus]|uniref:L-glutamate gamma-semialdehyde dehydrogenase n=1 Tax=Motilibacter aurantiacus TaxID=2714955 RepID=UPI00140E85B3|nr:L-glutamate gamma-semialdehyde dehydrogenase [Motilibacter aurantiacus]NHC47527.1 L-glutamate gamma-semialdehyde dehydrogenase [Motilibacter aurantiacus]